ncbi:MAG: alkaline phosphatase family protein [Clostridiales bacterium]|nr:alkaline phosphatase family protein [Clostridiales bacterium]
MNSLKRREFLKWGIVASSLFAVGGRTPHFTRITGKADTRTKILVLGFDGLDPRLLEMWMEADKLPAFRRLRSQGDFRPLQTSVPPQSPVAWANFITGTDPGGHGIFDFMNRDLETYIPVFSGTATEEAKTTLRFGDLVLPLRGGKVRNLIKGRAFWQILEDHDIPATVFKMPSNYPPVPTKQRTLSGMGTPDIKGYYGLFNYYTDQPFRINEDIGGGRIHQVSVDKNTVEARLPGPTNTFKKDRPESTVDFKVVIDPVNPVAKISYQDQEFILKEKEWSGWKRVRFHLLPTQSVSGICMFYLKEIRPHFKLYVTPINIDPASAALPISTPESYAQELEKKLGPFFTKGLPADTSALDHDVLDEAEFLEQDDMIFREGERMFEHEFNRFDSGLLFYYVSSTDQRQHMFWRLLDQSHPMHDPGLVSTYGRTIENIYVEADRFLDSVLQRIGKDTLLLVMSDHGFNPFRRGFNLNTWLFENGYHKLRNPWRQEDTSLFDNTDWSRTKAYGVGLNGLYINQKGRERQGIVNTGADSENLIREIANKLEQVVDPKTGERAILRAFVAKDVYRGRHLDLAPDIVLGFNYGYRISWGSPLGKFPRQVFEDNTEKWSGDHMSAPEVIPGILFTNRKVRAESPALYDLTATILDVFGIAKPEEMTGRSIF